MTFRVLLTHNRYQQQGGEDSVVRDEFNLLEKHGHSVELYTRDNNEIELLNKLNVAVDTIWCRRTSQDVRQLINDFKPDIIHSHNTFPLISPSIFWLASKSNIPIVQTLHNFRYFCLQAMFLREGKICEDCVGKLPWRGVVKRCYRNSFQQSSVLLSSIAVHRFLGTYQKTVSQYIALNDFCRHQFVKAGLPRDRISVKPNFVDIPRIVERERGAPLFVGRLSPEKGIRTILEAVKRYPNLYVDIVGTGPLAELAQNSPNMLVHGWLEPDATIKLMRKASYLVMPSIWYENFPRTLVEAFACGLPVIASDLGAMAELIEDGKTGLLFKPGSADDLAEKMEWANANNSAMCAMGERARTVYEEKYTPQINHSQLLKIYNDAISSVYSS